MSAKTIGNPFWIVNPDRIHSPEANWLPGADFSLGRWIERITVPHTNIHSLFKKTEEYRFARG